MKFRFVALIAVFLMPMMHSQVPPPKPEHLFHHLFAPHHDEDELEQRSKSLSCAVVLITAGTRTGTGFYISPDGNVATAAHVLGDKLVIPLPTGKVWIGILGPGQISIKSSEDKLPEQYTVSQILDNNADAFAADVAILKTHRNTSCWLVVGPEETIHTGEHVLALGFPGLSFGSLTMYSGIVSGRIKSTLPMGKTIQGQAFISDVEFIRAQMPLSPGFSGAPLIDDKNRAIGVVTNAGAWSPDLDQLIQAVASRGPQASSVNGPDLQTMIGELAAAFHDYGSPGYGDAVPMRYLGKAKEGDRLPLLPAR
jgi:hypothetical protein